MTKLEIAQEMQACLKNIMDVVQIALYSEINDSNADDAIGDAIGAEEDISVYLNDLRDLIAETDE